MGRTAEEPVVIIRESYGIWLVTGEPEPEVVAEEVSMNFSERLMPETRVERR